MKFRFPAKKINITAVILILAAMLSLSACNRQEIPMNAIYFWQPELTLTQQEQKFLAEQHVTTIYLHLFDVVKDKKGTLTADNKLRFHDRIPKGLKVVPVVFIDQSVINDNTDVDTLARLIVNDAISMMEKNGYPTPAEIQVDYDWNTKTEGFYFNLLKKMRNLMHDRDGSLSSAIRFHHLSMHEPPVDYAVLMLYDSGVYNSPDEIKSVLSYAKVHEYIHGLKTYELPLATVLPIYGWDMVYSKGKFRCVARGLTLKDTTQFQKIATNRYVSKGYNTIPIAANTGLGGRIYPNDTIIHEQPTPGMLDSVASLISRVRPGDCGNIVLYHLNGTTLRRYDKQFLKQIFDGGSMATTDNKATSPLR